MGHEAASHAVRAATNNRLAGRTFLSDVAAVKSADLPRRPRRLATKRGWDFEVVQGGRHTKVRLRGRTTVVQRHPVDLKTGTLRGILGDLGLTPVDLEE